MASNPGEPAPGPGDLAQLVSEVARLLPAQGPISIFIHHNTLHAFEHLDFEEAVVTAGERLGCEPFASEDHYRAELARGRIAERDLDAVLRADLGEGASESVGGLVARLDLRRRLLLHGLPEARGTALSWLLGETSVIERFRRDLPDDAREAVAATRGVIGDAQADETRDVRALWDSCMAAVVRAAPLLQAKPPALRRHRDLLLAARGIDTDATIHPLLIRFLGAYLDQGLAQWSMPLRERGMHACFVDIYGARLASLCAPWGSRLRALLLDERRQQRAGLASLAHSLRRLGVADHEWRDYLTDTALALRGWAGMVRQLEERPDRVPARALPATLVDFLAVHLLLERAALEQATAGDRLSLAALRAALAAALPQPPALRDEERAWGLFHLAQLCGISPWTIDACSEEQITALERELGAFDAIERRRLFQLAYERHLRLRFYDALCETAPSEAAGAPSFQAIFCIDEREESFRRHLEEVDGGVETFGAAGFFGVAMYYQGATDAHPRPLCPVAIVPEHYVAEIAEDATGWWARWRALQRRGMAIVDKNVHIGSRTLVRGSLVMALLGTLAIIPLVLRVVFPWLVQRLSRFDLPLAPRRTRLDLERRDAAPPIGAHFGFTVAEMADIVQAQLESVGIADRLAPLVLVLGHGSVSLNNPHESAHDCGACGGGHGGPNARALARMANDPRVRAILSARGAPIPAATWFVGGERNTASNRVTFYDEERLPEHQHERWLEARALVETAREREAHERCRRFDVVGWLPARAALLHVESRSGDLAQPRPEYGHATNAFCVVGRRARTRGLFLDRRSFLVSYDPTRDPDGRILERLLAAVVPVVVGISLEYYFGFVDPTGYGCGTKLPHNVASLLGVMDGAGSDLRTGLPWQMIEIHEPVRLSLVVEAPRERLEHALEGNPDLARLVRRRWLALACLEPDSTALWELGAQGFERHAIEHAPPVSRGDSAAYYRNRRGHLPFARLEPTTPIGTGA